MDAMAERSRVYQGYIDERSTHHLRGWLRDLGDPAARLAYEVVLQGEGGRVLHTGVADGYSDVLVQVGVGDGRYAFEVRFAEPLSLAERDAVCVRPAGSAQFLELAPGLRTEPPGSPAYQGYLHARSPHHVSGWVWDRANPGSRIEVEAVLPGPEARVLARTVAARFDDSVRAVGIGDGEYAFFARFDPPLTAEECDRVIVRPAGSAQVLEHAPGLRADFTPIQHVAMDIVNNCNLRCPFCVYDYAETQRTMFMSDATFEAALRLIPFVTDGNFWLSCLHEATLHPKQPEFIARVPREYRRKLFFTTNLAKRLPARFFTALAQSGMSHINISLESLDPPVYERLRKGARFGIFAENWAELLAAFAAEPAAPPIRYNMMAYRSNFLEIPELCARLLAEKAGWQVEIRHTFDEPHIPQQFRAFEYLTTAEWAWLAAELAAFPADRVMLLLPPGGTGYDRYDPPPIAPKPAPGAPEEVSGEQVLHPFNVSIRWDGNLHVYAEKPRQPGEPPAHTNYLISNINALEDPLVALFALEARSAETPAAP